MDPPFPGPLDMGPAPSPSDFGNFTNFTGPGPAPGPGFFYPPPIFAPTAPPGEWLGAWYWYILAGVCVTSSLITSVLHIVDHLKNYTEPVFQRYIVRIIFMVPLYAATSWLSLLFRDAAIYFDTIRDCYEAFVIYNFLSLCLAYCGGPGAVVVSLQGKVIEPSWIWGTCCFPPITCDGRYIRSCKQGVLQFVFVKPIMAAVTLVLYQADMFHPGDFNPAEGYLYISIVYNITYTVALYSLFLFYAGCKELLKPFKPVFKFVMVKLVVFATFWQGFIISLLVRFAVIGNPEDGVVLQSFLLCLEMFPAAMLLRVAFPASEYAGTQPSSKVSANNVAHAMSIKDVFTDTVHQFAPSYNQYVLYDAKEGQGKDKDPELGKEKSVQMMEQPPILEFDILDMGVGTSTTASSGASAQRKDPAQAMIDMLTGPAPSANSSTNTTQGGGQGGQSRNTQPDLLHDVDL